jgi:sortase A
MTQKTILRISALVSALSGAMILFATFYPIVSYEATAGRKFPSLVSPVVQEGKKNNVYSGATSQESSSAVDYTNPQNWFVGANYNVDKTPRRVSFYTLSIPKLEIKDVTVEIGGSDLSKSLVQYPGTAPPGKPGNAVIFGHSILPIFNNPKNYISIFSLLPTLERGDFIEVKYDGVTYDYVVETMFEIVPTDLQVLDQQPDSSYLTLVTCVPPGHPLKPKRLIVRAKVQSFNKGLERVNK